MCAIGVVAGGRHGRDARRRTRLNGALFSFHVSLFGASLCAGCFAPAQDAAPRPTVDVRVVARVDHPIASVAFSSDDQRLIVTTASGEIDLCDPNGKVAAGRLRAPVGTSGDGEVIGALLLSDTSTIVSLVVGGTLRRPQARVLRFSMDGRDAHEVRAGLLGDSRVSAAGRSVVVASRGVPERNMCEIAGITSRGEAWSWHFTCHDPNDRFGFPCGVAANAAGTRAALAWSDGIVTFCDAAGGAADVDVGEPGIAMTFAPNAEDVAIAGSRRVAIWNATTGRVLRTFGSPQGGCGVAAFDDGGTRLAVGNRGGRLRIVDATAGTILYDEIVADRAVTGLAFAKGGDRLAVAAIDRVYLLSDLPGTRLKP